MWPSQDFFCQRTKTLRKMWLILVEKAVLTSVVSKMLRLVISNLYIFEGWLYGFWLVEARYFDGLFLSRHIMFQLENFIGIMTMKRDAKYDIRNLVSFHASSQKSENLHFDGFLLSKADKVMQSLKKNWLLVLKMTWIICWILMRTVTNLKNFDKNFCRKYIMTEPKKGRRIMCHNTKKWCKIWGGTDLCFEKWIEEIWRILMKHSKVSKSAL